MHLIVAITGASGAPYGIRFVERAVALGASVDLIVSPAGERVAQEEVGFTPDPRAGAFRELLGDGARHVRRLPVGDIGAAPASGSTPSDGMVIIPCSMGTLGRLAAGTSGNLIERAADVTMKEGRPLVLVPRETPLNRIHLVNMTALADAGARIVPAMPSFYGGPVSVEHLVDSVVDRAASFLFGSDAIQRPWRESPGEGA